jgi:hypothetical protein
MDKIMKPSHTIIMAILLGLLLSEQAYSSPKVTQAALINFKTNHVTALAIEEFGKPLSLSFLGNENKVIYSTQFGKDFAHRSSAEFSYANPFFRFRSFRTKGLPSPIVVAIAAAPLGSDESFEIKVIAEKNGKIVTLNSEPIDLSIQDGIYLGYINSKYNYGMITWEFQWEDDIHYAHHRYKMRIYEWEPKSLVFALKKTFTTKTKFKNGCAALRYYGLPCKNFRDKVVRPDEDIGTLGIESDMLLQNNENKQSVP